MPRDRLLSHLPVLAVVVTFSLLTPAAGGTLDPVVSSASRSSVLARPDAMTQVRMSNTYGKLPLYFEANRGQTDRQVKFLSHGAGHTLFLTSTEAVLVFTRSEPREGREALKPKGKPEKPKNVRRTVVRMTFLDANPKSRVVGQEELPGKANYFIGNDPSKWRTDVPTYAKVQYTNVYPGIDLIYYGNQRQLEYDYVVGPGADPKRIRLSFQGADKLELDAQGDLVLHTAAGVIRQRKPVIYQEVEGRRREIAGGYVLKGARRVGFRFAAYNASIPLVIDPALFYSTYLGGSAADQGFGIAVDASGNAYVTGYTASTDFPTIPGAFQTTLGSAGSTDAFVTKLNPTGSALVYSTYLGGSQEDLGLGIAIDPIGNAYVIGHTDSTDFPTTLGAFQTALRSVGHRDVFVTKLNPTGSALVYSTYLGGSQGDQGFGIAVDTGGNAYVTGFTGSTDFPTTPGAFQTSLGGPLDAFVTKLDPLGSALVYSTYLGGSNVDSGAAIAVDPLGNAYVIGDTISSDFPTSLGALQRSFGGGVDAFVAKLNAIGSALVFSTYLGGSSSDDGLGIAVDTGGSAYVTGFTTSTDFPTTLGAFQTTLGGSGAAFVTKLDATGSAVYSTYLNGTGFTVGFSLAVDLVGNAYVTGFTDSTDFPTTAGAFQTSIGSAGSTDAFVTKLNPAGSAPVYSTYLGGSDDDQGRAIVIDTLPSPNAYVTGHTYSTDFPTTAGAVQITPGNKLDAFVAQIADVTLLPGAFSARVTGGGTINVDVMGGIGNFHFIVQRQADTGELSGRLQYVNHVTGARVQSETITSLMIAGNTATFGGTCTLNGAPCTFTVNVTDNGEPGTNDTFTISYPTPDGGTLRSGNILIR